jgi:DNA-binding CsgD family transcriptional regulator
VVAAPKSTLRVLDGSFLFLNSFSMRLFSIKYIFLYAVAMALLLLLLQWMQYRLLIIDHAMELYIAGIAIVFTVLGIWLAKKLSRPKTKVVTETVVIEKQVPVYRDPAAFSPDHATITSLGLSQRELEVLALMAEGASNQEIADRLFVSLNTVKTHGSRLFEKLDVKRRTQAIEKAKRLNIIS